MTSHSSAAESELLTSLSSSSGLASPPRDNPITNVGSDDDGSSQHILEGQGGISGDAPTREGFDTGFTPGGRLTDHAQETVTTPDVGGGHDSPRSSHADRAPTPRLIVSGETQTPHGLDLKSGPQRDGASGVAPYALPLESGTFGPGEPHRQYSTNYGLWDDTRSQRIEPLKVEFDKGRLPTTFPIHYTPAPRPAIKYQNVSPFIPAPPQSQHYMPPPPVPGAWGGFQNRTPFSKSKRPIAPGYPSIPPYPPRKSKYPSDRYPPAPYLPQKGPRPYPDISGNPYNSVQERPTPGRGPKRGFVVIDPFAPSVAYSMGNIAPSEGTADSKIESGISPYLAFSPQYHININPTKKKVEPSTSSYVFAFLTDTLPRQVYLHFLLRLPSLYFSRVTRIFKDAELSTPDIQKLALETVSQSRGRVRNLRNFYPVISDPSSFMAFQSLESSWEGFIDSVMREWKTTNIVSILLVSAILTTLQFSDAAADPITRQSGIMSLICGLMSLLYGCMYIIRFGTMRIAYKAAAWAEEVQQSKTYIWWNVWVFLAMPTIWLSWSIILYLVCIMSFVWRTGSDRDPAIELTPTAALGPRVVTTAIFALGVFYFVSIVRTLSRYGEAMDKAWQRKLADWAEHPEKFMGPDQMQLSPPPPPGSLMENQHLVSNGVYPVLSSGIIPIATRDVSPRDPSIPVPAFDTFKVTGLHFGSTPTRPIPDDLLRRGVRTSDWVQFITDVSLVWNGRYPSLPINTSNHNTYSSTTIWSRPQDVTARFLDWWNAKFFYPLQMQVLLCQEYPEECPDSPVFSVYMRDSMHPLLRVDQFFVSTPKGLSRIYIFEPANSAAQITVGLRRAVYYAEGEPLHKPSLFPTTKVVDLRFKGSVPHGIPKDLADRDIQGDVWDEFIKAASDAWNAPLSVKNEPPNSFPRPQDAVHSLIAMRNAQYFRPRAAELILCEEFLTDHPQSSTYAIYLMDLKAGHRLVSQCFGQVPDGIDRIDLHESGGGGTDVLGVGVGKGRASLYSEEVAEAMRVRAKMGMEV